MSRNSISVMDRVRRKPKHAENGKEMGRIVTNFIGEVMVV